MGSVRASEVFLRCESQACANVSSASETTLPRNTDELWRTPSRSTSCLRLTRLRTPTLAAESELGQELHLWLRGSTNCLPQTVSNVCMREETSTLRLSSFATRQRHQHHCQCCARVSSSRELGGATSMEHLSLHHHGNKSDLSTKLDLWDLYGCLIL